MTGAGGLAGDRHHPAWAVVLSMQTWLATTHR